MQSLPSWETLEWLCNHALTCKHQWSPGKICCAAACCGMLQVAGGGYPDFPKAAKVAKSTTKHKGMHVLTPCKDEHGSIISWAVMLLLPSSHFRLWSIFLTCMIAQWRNAPLLISRPSCVRMCPNILTQAKGSNKQISLCRSMLRPASNPPPRGPQKGAVSCCGMLQSLSLAHMHITHIPIAH